MDRDIDIEQVIESEIETLRQSLRRLTEGPIPLRLWSKRAGGDLVEETDERIAELDRTIRIYQAIQTDLNRRQPGWLQPAMAAAPLTKLVSTAR